MLSKGFASGELQSSSDAAVNALFTQFPQNERVRRKHSAKRKKCSSKGCRNNTLLRKEQCA
eukprot:scaffold37933_cov201-Skeletonema_marinoi.AAC.6